MLTGNAAAAWGARLAEVEYIPAFPITPQTEIIEELSRWIRAGEMDARMVTMDSEHSMLTAAGFAGALYGDKDAPPVLLPFVGGLGGRQFQMRDFHRMIRALIRGEANTGARLLYSKEEEHEVEGMLRIAGKAV
jgi:hypothetical protein